MNLKNYLLEYVSSGRGKKNIPVEPDTILKVGDVVRVKDEKWFDSLEKNRSDYGIVSGSVKNHDLVIFTRRMTKYLGKTVIIRHVYKKTPVIKVLQYGVDLYEEGEEPKPIDYVFTNEMLEYI
jgi:hypothetical protein